MDERVRKAIFPHRLTAGLGMVLLAIVWAFGWITAPSIIYTEPDSILKLRLITVVLGSWNLLCCVIAAGFFHAASVNQAKTFMKYRMVSLLLLILGILVLFPVPMMSQVLGDGAIGRAMALLITGMSFAAIAFGRARINAIYTRLLEFTESDEGASLIPF